MNAATPAGKSVAPMAYHRRIVEHLRKSEADLWQWSASSERRAADADTVRLELLKSTYRLDAESHPALFGIAEELRTQLQIDGTISIYQLQLSEGFNASLAYLPGEAHILLTGPVLALLSAAEQRALLAHELAHYLLLSGWSGEFLVAGDLIRSLAGDSAAGPEYNETLRLWNLYTELFCDRWALAATGDLGAAVRTLVKVQTGLSDVNADSYLRQAADIFRAGPIKAGAFTHPELYIRARALELWQQQGDAADPEIERLIQGPLNFEQLDLLAQRTATELTDAILHQILRPDWMRSDANLAHARQFFPDLETRAVPALDVRAALESADKSAHDYTCFVLLDFASVDRELGEAAVAASWLHAQAWGVDERFADLAQRELGLTKKAWNRLTKEANTLVQRAEQSAAEASPA